MRIDLTVSQDERHSCRRAARWVRAIAAGLMGTSDKDAARCERYAATVDAIANGGERYTCDEDARLDVEQASSLLEGIRNGLDNAELDTAAAAVQRDIERLNDLVMRYNTAASLPQ
jgi:hypothetical protein